MLDGKTSEGLAIANAAILLRLIDELRRRAIIPKDSVSILLLDAADSWQTVQPRIDPI